MLRFFNEYSFPILLAVFAITLALALPVRSLPVRLGVVAALLLAVLGGYLMLRPGGSTVASISEADTVLEQARADGRPVFIEFFSNT